MTPSGYFTAMDANGKRYFITTDVGADVGADAVEGEGGDSGQALENAPNPASYKTRQGLAVKRVAKGVYELASGRVRLTSMDPAAP